MSDPTYALVGVRDHFYVEGGGWSRDLTLAQGFSSFATAKAEADALTRSGITTEVVTLAGVTDSPGTVMYAT